MDKYSRQYVSHILSSLTNHPWKMPCCSMTLSSMRKLKVTAKRTNVSGYNASRRGRGRGGYRGRGRGVTVVEAGVVTAVM